MAFQQNKPIAIGMVGGGPDSGIGETHRIAMRIDNKCELIAGAFSRSREKSLVVAKELRIAGERIYDNYQSIWISMAAAGNEQGIRIRVYGDKGSLEWFHEDPFHLRFCSVNGPAQTFAQGTDCVSDEARRWTRGGLGHPEGYFEAFANLYSELADVIGAKGTGRDALGFPVAVDGAKGLAFVEAFLRSYHSGGTWTNVEAIQ